jgi:hypothetical protein
VKNLRKELRIVLALHLALYSYGKKGDIEVGI